MNIQKILKMSAITSFLLVSNSVFAHTHLEDSIPADEQVLKEAPSSVQLNFNAAVRLMKFEIKTDKDVKLELGFKPDTDAKDQFMVAIPGLEAGSYKVNWAVIGADGHTVANSFSFAVDPNADPHGHGQQSEGHSGHSGDSGQHSH